MKKIDTSKQSLKAIGQSFTIEALCGEGIDAGVREALERCGPPPRRRGLLQPAFMLWFMICSALHRTDSLPQVLSRMLMPLRDRGIPISLKPVTDGAIAHARRWFGYSALQHFFLWLGERIKPARLFHGLHVWIIDGTMFNVPDSKQNQEALEVFKSSKGRCGYPMFKVLFLVDAATRRIRDVVRGLWRNSERALALILLRHVGGSDLLLLDRGFYGVWFMHEILRRGAHFLIRVPNTVRIRGSRQDRRRGDFIMRVHSRMPHRHGMPADLDLRIVEYQIAGFRPCRLATSLGPEVPAHDVVREYHARWEIELALDEIKTHLGAPAVGQTPTLMRSQNPANVEQEFYALLCAYNLIREVMGAAAATGSLPLQEISFVGALHALRLSLPVMQSSCACDLGRLYAVMLRDIAGQVNDRPRRARSYPRALKVRLKRGRTKQPTDKERRVDLDSIKIGTAA
jgi:hypothetical protein